MDATKLLKGQHDEVKALFKKYEGTEGVAKGAIFAEIADKLAAHSTLEEKVFYPAAYVGDLKEDLQEAVEEHLAVKRVIADLLEMNSADEGFDAKMKVLKEQVEHHVEEEEGELFPKVRKALPKDQLESMGIDMENMFQVLIAEEPRLEIPAETDHAAPLA